MINKNNFVDWGKDYKPEDNIQDQASKLEQTLSDDPDKIFDFLAQPLVSVNKNTVKAVNLTLDHLVETKWEEEAFDTMFWKINEYNSSSVWNAVASSFMDKYI